MSDTLWAVKQDRRCRLFHDMMVAVRLFNVAPVGTQLWGLFFDGWLMISYMVPRGKSLRQSNRPMNREVLVAEGGA